MQELKYTKNEIIEFQKALDVIIDDLEALWQIGALSKIKVHADLPNFSKCDKTYTNNAWFFIMEKESFYLQQINFDRDSNIYYFAKRKKNGKLQRYLDIKQQDIIFLNNYDQIRKVIVEEIENALIEKNKDLEMAKKITQKYAKKATIEIEMPKTANQHTLEITTENGQQIGTIKLGNISLRIITDDSIEIKQNAKVKKK